VDAFRPVEEVAVTKKLLAGTVAVVVFALVLFAAMGCGSAVSLPKNVLGQVGSVQITQDQFDAELAVYQGIYGSRVPDQKTNPTEYKNFENFVLDHMITYEVVKEKAATLNISLSDQEVQDQIDTMKQNSFGGDQTKFDAGLKASNLTLAQLEAYYRERMLVEKAHSEVTKNVAGPSEAEISAYYDAHKSSYYTEETRTARHILISPVKASTSTSDSASSTTTAAPTEAEWAAALTKAQKVRADLVAGADWKTEAATYSDDTGTKKSGGNLGTIKKGQMVAEFEQAVFSLAKDEISQPVKTVYGYHIIQVTGITPAAQKALADVKSSIQATLLTDKENQVWNEWLAKTKAELKVVTAEGWEYSTTTTAGQSATSTSASTATTGAGGSATTSPASTAATSPATTTATVSPTTTTAPEQSTTTTT
jgi:parvulin-like peptidyl-prolyl isomerase